MKSQEIDFRIMEILKDIEDPKDGFTTIELTKLIFGEECDEMSNEKFARACGRVSRRMGAIRHELYEDMYKTLKERAVGIDLFHEINDPKVDPLGSDVDGKDLRPSFLPFALPIKHASNNGNVGATWKYFNAARHPHIGNVVENHFVKSAGLEFRARLLQKVYES